MAHLFTSRLQLAEFGDQPWLRGWWRDAYLDCLNLGLRIGGQFRALHRPYATWAARAPGAAVLDLGSGGAGPIQTMLRSAQRDGTTLPEIYLSDLHPCPDHYRALQMEFGEARLRFIAEPLSATDVTRRDIRLRSICSTLHHLPPQQAESLVADAVRHADGLFIVEPLQRDLRHLLLVLLSGPFPYLLAPFFARTWSWRKFFVCTLVPIVPLMVMVDGCVSVLRAYTPAEIEDMIPASERDLVQVQFGTLRYGGLFACLYTAITRRRRP